MKVHELVFTPAYQLADYISSKQLSPVELTKAYLERIEKLNPEINAYLTVAGDQAIADAVISERMVMSGAELGPLHGVPIAVKDMEETAGIRTTFGSLLFEDHVPNTDSLLVKRIRDAGALILGKTNTPEFAQSGTTENRLLDACRNPWDITRTSGGSSGGSAAALASGLCALATGSDAGGSIRIPASFCGVYGIKPTLGRVPALEAVARPAPNHTNQSGPMSTTVKDSAILLQVLAGPDDRDVTALRQQSPDYLTDLQGGVEDLRIAWSPDLGYASVDAEVINIAYESAKVFEELGAIVEEPDIKIIEPYDLETPIASTIFYVQYSHLLQDHSSKLTDYVRDYLEKATRITASDYARSLHILEQLQFQISNLMETYDLLLTPTTSVPAFPVGSPPGVQDSRQIDDYWAYTPFTPIFNLTGQPAASIPCGFSSNGLPKGLHLIGRRGDELTVLKASSNFEKARPWTHKRPQFSIIGP